MVLEMIEVLDESHPMRVRGLKHANTYLSGVYFMSHPMRVRGLKPLVGYIQLIKLWSHPMRVRGLKHP